MVNLSISDINGLYNQFLSISNSVEDLLDIINERILQNVYASDIKATKLLSISYENACKDLISIKDNLNFSLNLVVIKNPNFESIEIPGILYLIKSQCDKALGLLKSEKSDILTKKQKDQLNLIRKEIKIIELASKYTKNLDFGIKHLENGSFLASALILSRLIVYCIDNIPKDESDVGDEKILPRINFLISKGIIDKEHQDEKQRILKYVNTARNYLVHDVSKFPEFSDCATLLGDCVNILKIFKQVEDIKAYEIEPSIIDDAS